MGYRLFVVGLLALAANAQFHYQIAIPCEDQEACKKYHEKAVCNNYNCLCPGPGKWENCRHEDGILGEKPKGSSLSCDHDDDCHHINDTLCLPVNVNGEVFKQCQCQAHLIMNANNTRCLRIALAPDAECSEEAQCTAGLGNSSECVGAKCRCKAKYHFVAETDKHCVPNKGYGAKCTPKEQSCFEWNANATKNVLGCSRSGVCKCIKNYSFNDGWCQRSNAVQMVPQILILMVLISTAIKFF